MLAALKSLKMSFSDVCKNAKPRAAPTAILSRMSQESGSIPGLPAKPNNSAKKHNF